MRTKLSTVQQHAPNENKSRWLPCPWPTDFKHSKKRPVFKSLVSTFNPCVSFFIWKQMHCLWVMSGSWDQKRNIWTDIKDMFLGNSKDAHFLMPPPCVIWVKLRHGGNVAQSKSIDLFNFCKTELVSINISPSFHNISLRFHNLIYTQVKMNEMCVSKWHRSYSRCSKSTLVHFHTQWRKWAHKRLFWKTLKVKYGFMFVKELKNGSFCLEQKTRVNMTVDYIS